MVSPQSLRCFLQIQVGRRFCHVCEHDRRPLVCVGFWCIPSKYGKSVRSQINLSIAPAVLSVLPPRCARAVSIAKP